MEVKGFRIHDIPSGVTTNDLSIYFEKSQNGGTELEEIYYPLSDNSAVIVFTNDEYKRAFDKDHALNGKKLALSRLPVQLFSSTTVYLEQAITQLLDENPPLMRSLENESDMEVMFDAKSMTYKICGNSFQIEWATKFLTDMWQKNQENKRTNPKTPNGKEEETKELEARRSPQMAESTDSDSSDNVSYASPSLSLYKRKENSREIERTLSPSLDHDHFSNGSKKTKRSTAPNAPQQKSFSDMEMLHQTGSNIVADRKTDSSLKMSDCKLSHNDPRSGKPHPVKSPNMDRGSYQTRRQNLSDIEKSKSLSKASHVPHPRTFHFKSGVSREQMRVPMVFNNYNSDSDEDGNVGSRSPIGFSTRETQMMRRRPPPPPRPRDHPIVHPRPSRSFQPGMSLSQTDFPDLALEYESPVGSVIVKLAMGDILAQKTDAIISPASTDLITFFGISAVIARNADRKMKEECANHVTQNGNLLFGDVIHTCAGGNLDPKVTYILHAAVPTWREDIPEQSAHLLTCTYLNCFQYAEKIWLRSLSMPVIGAGYFGAPLDACVQSFHDAILLFTRFHEKKAKHLQEIQLVSNDRDSACSSVVVFKSLMDLEEEQARKAAVERYCKGSEMYDFSARDFVLRREESSGDERHESDNERRSEDVAENKLKYPSNEKLDSECSAKKGYSSANSTDSDEIDQSFPARSQVGRKENGSDSKKKENIKASHDDERDLWEDVKNENRSTNGFSFEESKQENARDRDLHQMESRVSSGENASFPTEYTEVIDDTASSSVIEKLLTRRGSD